MPAYCYGTAATSASGTAWAMWTTDSTTTADVETTWDAWTTSGRCYTTSSATTAAWMQWTLVQSKPAPEPTPEERARREEADRKRREEWAQQEEVRRQREAEEKKREEEADRRAEELLVAHLDDEQKEEYKRDRSFHVRAKDGRRYRVYRAWSGHVARVNDQGKPVERFCIHPRVKVPLPDNQLFAKLMLETDPETFRRTANVTPVGVG